MVGMLGLLALAAALIFAANSNSSGQDFLIADRGADLNPECGVTVLCVTEEVANSWVNLPSDYKWQAFPGTVHDHPPLKCDENDILHSCSERYRHRFDPKIEEPGYYLLRFQCGAQTITRMNDGAHPDGAEVKVYEECPKDFVGPSPTPERAEE
jgi:hypothetical protein